MIKVIAATPSSIIYSGEARRISMSTSSGEITVLAGHEPLMTTIDAGQIIINNKEGINFIFSAYNGVVNIENTKGLTTVRILMESSEDVKGLDDKSLEESIERAKQANVEKMDDFGLEINSELLRDLNRIKLARRYNK